MQIKVHNFQSIQSADLTAEGFTAVTGPSNRGKSALVRAVAAALFNRPGEGFVRLGATYATVALDAPGIDGASHHITWTKGHGANEFTVDGATYNKVGLNAPTALQEIGYRDLWIGDEARGRGEALRPQVAQQFDGLFLLGRSGSFIAEVIARISRVMVLQRAHGRASADLKAQKGLLVIRQRDLVAAEDALTALEPIRDLDRRVTLLKGYVEALRTRAVMVTTVQRAVARRAQVAPQAVAQLPPVTLVPRDHGATVVHVRQLLDRRTALLRATASPLPMIHRVPGLELVQARVVQLRGMVTRRASAAREVYDGQRAVRAAEHEEAIVRASYAERFATLKVCPLCERAL